MLRYSIVLGGSLRPPAHYNMIRDSNNNIEGFEQLLKEYTSRFIYVYLILPLETCQHLFKRCSLRNMKFTFFCLTFIKCMRYIKTTDNEIHNGTRFAKKYRALQMKRISVYNVNEDLVEHGIHCLPCFYTNYVDTP